MVFLRRRCTEGGDHRVADELLDCSTGVSDLTRHRVIEAIEQCACALGILRVRECRRSNQVGEEHSGQLPLLVRRPMGYRARAARAEPRTFRK
jgi:hypothetical protein